MSKGWSIMNKSALRNFATKARVELLERVELQALKLGITADNIDKTTLESSDAIFVNGKPLLETERSQRDKLINRIEEIGYNRVMEETAYTWFNRFIALRYMEVNNYLPTRVRVLSSESPDSTEPDMMREALSLNLPIDKQYIYDLKMANDSETLFKYLIQLHCNDLNRYMPFMFETLEDYMMILFPEGLLGTDSFIREMTDLETISKEAWQEVEIIGWLYQYYISEENQRVIQAKKQYKPEELPAATQLFTPEWIVKYMVQNALGRYWVESNPEQESLIDNWEFYLKNREENYAEKIKQYAIEDLNIESITCFDPAMGSGHILVYMFDVLFEIYSKNGYTEREIPRLIIEQNLYGLDIDKRAYQLASFSVVMKALQYNRRFLRSIERDGLKINLAVIEETNEITHEQLAFLSGESEGKSYDKMKTFIEQFKDAKAIGSLLKITKVDKEFLLERINKIEKQANDLFALELKDNTLPLLQSLYKQSEIMLRKHDVFVTNPPYAGNRYIPENVKKHLNVNYKDTKNDLFSAFIEYSFSVTKENGQIGLITPFVWMFLSSYEKIRKRIVVEKSISTLIQLEYNGFEAAVVPVCSFTIRNYQTDLQGEYIRLSDFKGIENQPIKTLEAVRNPEISYRYSFNQNSLSKMPGSPIAYWIPEKLEGIFENHKMLIEYIDVTGSQNKTANNKKYLRRLWEVSLSSINNKWCLYIKGGNYRKWFGNIDYVVDWSKEARSFYRDNKTSNLLNEKYWFKKGITYNGISNKGFSVRIADDGIYDMKGPTFHVIDKELNSYFMGLLNTKVVDFIMDMYNPTMSIQMRDVNNIPVIITEDRLLFEKVTKLADKCINLSKYEWNSFETAWDFKNHLLLNFPSDNIEESFNKWKNLSEEHFNQLKDNEEKLNEIFIEVYGLQDELSPDVDEIDVTISNANLNRDIKSFMSYGVGCTFGRYSLDEDGLIYAGGEFDATRYKTFTADENNILPIVDGAYFEDDIVSRFINFVSVTYGEETLERNLRFIAEAIGKRTNETAREAIRRYFMNEFYKNHVQVYKKHPIYWLFTSGKEKAFNCLIYMHRYDKTTLSRMRTDYLLEVQTRYETRRNDLISLTAEEISAKEMREANKELKDIEKKIEELKIYDEKLHHMADMQIEIDLDDGVKVNYKKFEGLLWNIK